MAAILAEVVNYGKHDEPNLSRRWYILRACLEHSAVLLKKYCTDIFITYCSYTANLLLQIKKYFTLNRSSSRLELFCVIYNINEGQLIYFHLLDNLISQKYIKR